MIKPVKLLTWKKRMENKEHGRYLQRKKIGNVCNKEREKRVEREEKAGLWTILKEKERV
jgi:hypothetical protein